MEHFIVGHEEPRVHKEGLFGRRFADRGGWIERPRDVFHLGAHHQMKRRLGKCAHELLDQGKGAATKREDGTKERVRAERRSVRIFIEAKIHPGRVRTARGVVKEWRLARGAGSPYNPETCVP